MTGGRCGNGFLNIFCYVIFFLFFSSLTLINFWALEGLVVTLDQVPDEFRL